MCMCVFIQLYNKMPQFDLRVPLKVYLKKKKKKTQSHNYFIRKSRLAHHSVIYYLNTAENASQGI